ncbi:Uncharacterised protein [Actinobacillus equuli]|nr:Uncharacterised protein [Actinobacillus equuli]
MRLDDYLENSHALAFKKGDAKAIGMMVCQAGTAAKSFKGKSNICWVLQFIPSS